MSLFWGWPGRHTLLSDLKVESPLVERTARQQIRAGRRDRARQRKIARLTNYEGRREEESVEAGVCDKSTNTHVARVMRGAILWLCDGVYAAGVRERRREES